LKKEFYKNEIKNFSLKSIGINDNFDCIVEFENQVGVWYMTPLLYNKFLNEKKK